jgi:hypothetical protein
LPGATVTPTRNVTASAVKRGTPGSGPANREHQRTRRSCCRKRMHLLRHVNVRGFAAVSALLPNVVGSRAHVRANHWIWRQAGSTALRSGRSPTMRASTNRSRGLMCGSRGRVENRAGILLWSAGVAILTERVSKPSSAMGDTRGCGQAEVGLRRRMRCTCPRWRARPISSRADV